MLEDLGWLALWMELWYTVPMVLALVVNITCAVALTGAVIRKKKKCNNIKELE
tara:strand:+ start:72 stop:230 length:159 start_codon:yes stop_codon:yes gene_type:complete